MSSDDSNTPVSAPADDSVERVLPTTRETISEDKPLQPAVSVPRTISASHSTEKPTVAGEAGKIGRAIKSNPLFPELINILHWNNPVRSGLVFANANLVFLLLTYGGYSLLTVISYCILALLGAALAFSQGSILWARYVQGRSIDNPLAQKWKVSPISRTVLEKHMDSLNNLVNALVESATHVFLCNHVVFSLQVAALVYFYSLVGKWFDGITLLWIVTIVAFVWPRLYTEKKTDIDRLAGLALAQINTYTALAMSKIPIAKAPVPASTDKRRTH
eukprot:TRINITY_DN639_c0_g1_i1.p1 TRINITY_DN639_c0_g1~~TRINITY_DN639_c0_g1_i1.p1  ORF type:complete len:320 (-),score=55.44 TRINITY_DN639_c0_g1_i1:70-894(-)